MTTTEILLIIGGFFAGFVDSVAGGGGLVSLTLLLYLGLPTKLALGTNKLIGIAASFSSTIRYGLSGNIIWKKAGPGAIMGLAGSFTGAWLATVLRPEILQPVVIFGLIFVAVYSLTRKRFGDEAQAAKLTHWAWPLVLGFTLGTYDGFFGPGTGTFLMMSFIGLFGFSLLQASASARLINFATNLGAISLFLSKGFVDVRYALLGAIASGIGATIGSSLSIKKGAKFIRPLYLIVVWGLLIKVSWELFSSM